MIAVAGAIQEVRLAVEQHPAGERAGVGLRLGRFHESGQPSGRRKRIWIEEGLLLETRPDQMENFKNVDERWVNVDWDPGRHYSVPWQWGTTGVIVDTSVYKGDINTMGVILDPPAELVGKINVTPEMNDVLSMTIWYMRPLGVQVLALGYRTGEAWNESGYSNPDFDARLAEALAISAPEKRREVMKDLEQILQDSGVIIQPYWQKLYSHTAAKVKDYGIHQTFQMDLQKVWLDEA